MLLLANIVYVLGSRYQELVLAIIAYDVLLIVS